ncbi:hypothetical protein SDC9_184860 [bioreactor metagenome]|uniref:Uncharacterized protein n=1 Tax=bioreactor metagenome TaxID=1076179 RepID=A0A645HPQ0_9ZZZZ
MFGRGLHRSQSLLIAKDIPRRLRRLGLTLPGKKQHLFAVFAKGFGYLFVTEGIGIHRRYIRVEPENVPGGVGAVGIDIRGQKGDRNSCVGIQCIEYVEKIREASGGLHILQITSDRT